MAGLPNIDFLNEIDEIFLCSDGKTCGNRLDFIDINDDSSSMVNEIMSSQGDIDDSDMLAVDSSNALMGDPLPSLFGEREIELLEPQPVSPPPASLNPETLMPVSLPADSPTSPPASPDEPDSSSSENETLGPESASSSSAVELPPSCQNIAAPSVTVVKTVGSSSAPKQIVRRIIVKSRNNTPSSGKMVAPLNLTKPSHNLVKIPKGCSVVRMQSTHPRSRFKPAEVVESRVPVQASSPSSVSSTPESPRFISRTPSSSEENNLPVESLPFRSLRKRHISEVSEEDLPSSRALKRKAYELEPLQDPDMERCRRNAVNAKRNRELKKAHMADLQRKVEDISKERDQLAGENESLREAKLRLEQQVKHLGNILENQSKLSALIGKLGANSVVLGGVTSGSDDEIISSGMCLHVDGDVTTVEYCAYCAKKAGKKLSL